MSCHDEFKKWWGTTITWKWAPIAIYAPSPEDAALQLMRDVLDVISTAELFGSNGSKGEVITLTVEEADVPNPPVHRFEFQATMRKLA